MPEIWVKYGAVDIVLDIRAENLGQTISSPDTVIDEAALHERLAPLVSGSAKLVPLHYTESVQKVISALFWLCQQKSVPAPRILGDRATIKQLSGIPEGGATELRPDDIGSGDLVFVSEMELDGLFGFENTATRLLRRFGPEHMLTAYARRGSDEPAPCQISGPFEEARKFADGFEVSCIDILAGSKGITELAVGHPSQTASLCSAFESAAVFDAERHKNMIVSPGTESGSETLGAALGALWGCAGAVPNGGLIILAAECGMGLGSPAAQRLVEGRLRADQLARPTRYIDGMEDLLYLQQARSRLQVGLISVLPELYVKRLGMIPILSARHAVQYIKSHGARQKINIVSDGLRLLLR